MIQIEYRGYHQTGNTALNEFEGNLKVDGSEIDFTNLQASDPLVAGILWQYNGTVKISQG